MHKDDTATKTLKVSIYYITRYLHLQSTCKVISMPLQNLDDSVNLN